MSGKILARVPALSLALLLAACGGGGDSTPLVDTGESGGNGSSGGDSPQEVFLGLGINSGDTFIEGQIESDIKALSAGGTTRLRVFIVDRNNSNRLLTGEETEVRFSSNCVSTNDAELISPIVTSTGVAETTYTAKGCSPTDTILAKVNGAEASFTLNIATAEADRVVSIPLTETSIAPTGAGSTARPSEASVSFQIVDKNGGGLRGVNVKFSLTGDDSSAKIPVTLSQQEASSGSGGIVTTKVIAGSASTVVRVIATIEVGSNSKSTQSDPIAINSLIPYESGLTLAADNFIPDAQFTAGVEVSLSLFATDKNGQNIRGNTTVNFTTDGGSVQPECNLNNEGTCVVKWRSQSPFVDTPKIVASTIGEKINGEVGTIFQQVTLLISSSRDPRVTLAAGSEAKQYCATVSTARSNGTRVHPPTGTTVEFNGNGITLLSSKTSYDVGGTAFPSSQSDYEVCVFAERTTPTDSGSLIVTVTTPTDEVDEKVLTI
ncbi:MULTISPECIES: hypothetical protein [unclassified Marinobacter]|uniref:hypothetical protein n=1 Tax=unclassified Marinobacter TaxID=83889 RepID=UPI00200C8672|nr:MULTISPECIES: hypothetical protein [unclassified Marinobacter]UQG56826.1 hypothetical protein MIH16_03930 [Marinobacter sp. M4C]UQG65630.1 hypothetical protein MIH17_03930 [Marinobacter sp. M2C]UQG69910.1 hypothetical protein MIH19_03925 [Marinobacter sp. M1C]